MKFNLIPKLFSGGMMLLIFALSSCSKTNEKPNDQIIDNGNLTPTLAAVQPDKAYQGDTVIITGTNLALWRPKT